MTRLGKQNTALKRCGELLWGVCYGIVVFGEKAILQKFILITIIMFGVIMMLV